VIFFTLIFGILELARAMYVINTLAQVTRQVARDAAKVDYRDTLALDRLRQKAIFRNSPGILTLADPITDQHLRIDYMSLARASDGTMTATPIPSGALPSCPARNRQNCIANANGSNCIRLVRVQVCDPASASECSRIPYQTLVSLIQLPMNIPQSTTIVTAETLGYNPGDPLCP
jgi:Flp pilus assembly protein TadG